MKKEQFRTEWGNYTVHVNEVDPGRPFAIYLHGAGFNTHGERESLAHGLNSRLNVLWFDLLGCGDSPAVSPEAITWDHHVEDVAAIIRHFARGAVHVIGHCSAVHITHDLVRKHRELVRSVVWYSPVDKITDVYKHVLKRSFDEKRLSWDELPGDLRGQVDRFLSTPEEKFGLGEMMVLFQLVGRIRDFQELYWNDRRAMETYLGWMAEKPLAGEALVGQVLGLFQRGPLPVPSYQGIPVLMLHSDHDGITPWKDHGRKLVELIPHAQSRVIAGGFHWIQFEKTEECARETVKFLA